MSNFYEETQPKEIDNNLNIISNNNDINDDYIFTGRKNIDKIEEKQQNNNDNDFKNNFNSQQSIDFLENVKKEIIANQNNIKNNINNQKFINNNFTEEEEENNNIINNNNEEEIEEENEEINFDKGSTNKVERDNENINDSNNGNNDDEELPLITLNFISVCQCCKTSFDNSTNLPYLLKCGHFFCIKCINEYFTDKNGIKCPSDGLIAKSINELTLLNNLIPKTNVNISNTYYNLISADLNNTNIDNNTNNTNITNNQIFQNNSNLTNSSNYCSIHKGQKLSHVICDNNEIICVYCAFECFKKNPKSEIKELSSQLKDFISNLNEMNNINQNEVLNLHDSLKKIKNNKENEGKAINTFFDCIFEFLNEKKNEYLEQINNLFTINAKKLGDKLEEVTANISGTEKLKKNIEIFLENGGIEDINFKDNYNEILNKYLMLKQKTKTSKQKINLDEYQFVHIEEDKFVKNFLSLGEIKILNRKTSLSLNYNLSYNNKDNNINKLLSEENNNSTLEVNDKEKDKKFYKNKFIEKLINIKGGKSPDNKTITNKTQLKSSFKNKNKNYIILDDLSITNNNSYLNSDNNNILKFDNNKESENNNNFYINEKNDNKNRVNNNLLFNKKINFGSGSRKNTSFGKNNSKEKKVIIHKNAKSLYNHIEFPNYNTSLNNYNYLSKLNYNKRDKERNITVNNYQVHQTLKNSYNNNYNYGNNFNNSNYLNKLFEFNNSNLFRNNTNTNNIQTNRKKFLFLNGLNTGNKNNNIKFVFK